jgi:hypothetical protein
MIFKILYTHDTDLPSTLIHLLLAMTKHERTKFRLDGIGTHESGKNDCFAPKEIKKKYITNSWEKVKTNGKE